MAAWSPQKPLRPEGKKWCGTDKVRCQNGCVSWEALPSWCLGTFPRKTLQWKVDSYLFTTKLIPVRQMYIKSQKSFGGEGFYCNSKMLTFHWSSHFLHSSGRRKEASSLPRVSMFFVISGCQKTFYQFYSPREVQGYSQRNTEMLEAKPGGTLITRKKVNFPNFVPQSVYGWV